MTQEQEFILLGLKERLSKSLSSNSFALLYGSQARGDFHEGSDWDVLVVVDKEYVSIAENAEITYPLIMFGWQNGVEINPILYTLNEWNSYKNTPFYENVIKDGHKIAG